MPSVTSVCPACQSAMPAAADTVCPSCGTPAPGDPDLHTQFTRVSAAPRPTYEPETATEVMAVPGPTASGPLLAAPQQPDEIGRLGPYRVLGRLGAGGMGIVFRAEDPHLRRQVALKVMLPQFAADRIARGRFLREARAAAAVEHDHIVPIFQVGEDRGIPYLAMPVLKGEALSARIKAGGPLPLFHVVRIGREIAEGLAAAHAIGLIHRDVKPSNVWLEGARRRVRLLDFGLARSIEGVRPPDSNQTLDRDVVGTPAYMAPEQARHETVDGRTDLFSLGVVLYQMVAGHLPFKTGSAVVTLTSVALDDPQPPADLNPHLPPELNALILSLLAKRPEDRPASAAEVARRLADLEVELTAVPLPPGPPAGCDPFADLHEPDTAVLSGPLVGPKRPSFRWGRFAGLSLAAFVVAIAAGGLGAYLFLPAALGTLVIVSDDPTAEVVLKQDGALVRERTRVRRIGLKPGVYTVELAGRRDGDRVEPETVTVPRGGGMVVHVHREKLPVTPPDPDRLAALAFLTRKDVALRVQPFGGKEVTVKEAAALPPGRFHVLGITVPAKEAFRPDDLKRLEGLSKLNGLWLMGGQGLKDADLKPLADRKGLVFLGLCASDYSNEGLKNLTGMSGLLFLILDGNPKINDAGLPELAGLTKLRALSLAGTGVTGTRLKHLVHLPDLVTLNLSQLTLTDAGVGELAGLPNIQTLVLIGTNITDERLARLTALSKLTTLDLKGTPVTDAGIESLSRLTQLKHLVLTAEGVSEGGAQRLAAALPACTIVWKDKTFGPAKK